MSCKNCELVLKCTIANNEEGFKCERYINKPILKKWNTGLLKFDKVKTIEGKVWK